jgi:hypothetical protein
MILLSLPLVLDNIMELGCSMDRHEKVRGLVQVSDFYGIQNPNLRAASRLAYFKSFARPQMRRAGHPA